MAIQLIDIFTGMAYQFVIILNANRKSSQLKILSRIIELIKNSKQKYEVFNIKFLFPQKITHKKTSEGIQVYPGNSGFIRFAKRNNAIIETKRTWNNNYFQTEYYLIKESTFKDLLERYRKILEEKREKFHSKHPLIKLQKILKYIFKRNTDAKGKNKKFYHKLKAYSDKIKFLQLAIEIAAEIKSIHFSYGVREDPNEPYFPYVYYFQIKSKQISFHCVNLFPNIPEFDKEWIGYRNEKYPFDMKLIREIIKLEVS